ncbi:mast/stem cell growth factor receptor-related protein Kit-like [Paramacrobiotus metropolitanus]|uniref:mast/stem cell growth factor receptor-related protein Kit-like n=1 Tax=Paramacrobiotus metropolitanus TaxID=2943436 RepID=UPI002445D52A|nr:mast/stem cell growth factor receptor-related protein Kit-like [Paramacrobiotus metropolitanus]
MILEVRIFEDNSFIEMDDFQLYDNNLDTLLTDDSNLDKSEHSATVYGNVLGAFGLLFILAGVVWYSRWHSKLEYYTRISFCDVPLSLLKEFELPANLLTLLDKPLDAVDSGMDSRFCRVGLARVTAAYPKRSLDAHTQVAVKFLMDKHTRDDERCFLAEMATFMRAGRHDNTVSLVGVILKGRPMIVMEYCANGCLLNYLHDKINYAHIKANNPTADEAEFQNELRSLLWTIYQVAKGMEFLSGRNILHRDLAARNVLLDDNANAKISDFGLARAHSEYILQRSNVKLPLGWMAPETLISMEGRYTEKSDVWSFGVVVWESFTFGQLPYTDTEHFPDGLENQLGVLLQFLQDGKRLTLPTICPRWMSTLVAECWKWESVERPAFKDIVVAMHACMAEL